MKIHPLAIVSPKAQISANVSIGPFSVVEADVTIGEGCELASHVVIKDGTRLGPHTVVHEAAILGGLPQHINKPKQPGLLLIGANNTIREHATLHRAMKAEAATIVGDGNFLMAGVHVAHDCRIGNQVIFANNALLAGHVVVEDRAFVSGAVGVHQFCRIGRLAMVGAHAKVVQDVPPYVTIDGISGCVVGLNLVGLRRGGFTSDEIVQLKNGLPAHLPPRPEMERGARAAQGRFSDRAGGRLLRIPFRRHARIRARPPHATGSHHQAPAEHGRERAIGRRISGEGWLISRSAPAIVDRSDCRRYGATRSVCRACERGRPRMCLNSFPTARRRLDRVRR